MPPAGPKPAGGPRPLTPGPARNGGLELPCQALTQPGAQALSWTMMMILSPRAARAGSLTVTRRRTVSDSDSPRRTGAGVTGH